MERNDGVNQIDNVFCMLHDQWMLCSLNIVCNVINGMDCMCMREMTEIFSDFIRDESHGTKEVINFATPELSMNILPPLNKCGLKSIVMLTMGVIGCGLHSIQSP